jgi:geranylgeranyl diphosphate synthase type II
MNVEISKALKTACAMQLSEEWLLIHDDIQDHSFARRGKPALQRLYGNELALNAGDTLHIIMWKMLLDNQKILGPQKTFEIADEFYRMLNRTADGQAIEIMWTQNNKLDVDDNDWFFIADGKTAYYTIAAPLRFGGMIANADQEQLDLLANFGLYLGRCFQLVDDILDLTTAFKGPNQPAGNDIREGKKTLILSHLTRSASLIDKQKILKILNKSEEEKTDEDIAWVVKKMNEYKSIEYARKLALKLKNKSLEIFEKDLEFLSCQPARNNLKKIINFIVERKK